MKKIMSVILLPLVFTNAFANTKFYEKCESHWFTKKFELKIDQSQVSLEHIAVLKESFSKNGYKTISSNNSADGILMLDVIMDYGGEFMSLPGVHTTIIKRHVQGVLDIWLSLYPIGIEGTCLVNK